MIALHVFLQPLDASAATQLEQVFAEAFGPAIRVQPGFVFAHLLRPQLSDDAAGAATAEPALVLALAFETEEQRLAWVATAAHASVWPRVRALCADISRQSFDVLGRG